MRPVWLRSLRGPCILCWPWWLQAPAMPSLNLTTAQSSYSSCVLYWCRSWSWALALPTFSSTMTELNRSNSEVADTRRKSQCHLSASGVPVEQYTRILRFATHSLKQRSALTLGPEISGLLSETLASELLVNQRSAYIQIHPLFKYISRSHSEALLELFGAFAMRLYSDHELVFRTRTWSEHMHVTRSKVTNLLICWLRLATMGLQSR
jgi:hypothetical protein